MFNSLPTTHYDIFLFRLPQNIQIYVLNDQLLNQCRNK